VSPGQERQGFETVTTHDTVDESRELNSDVG
jgi:hypothetical protein